MKLHIGDKVYYETGYAKVEAQVIGVKRHWFREDEYLIQWEEDGRKKVHSPSQSYIWPIA
jgi:hypothetical protein